MSFVSDLEVQYQHMLRLGQHLDEHGYVILVRGLNLEAEHDRFLFDPLAGGMYAFIRAWSRQNKLHAVFIHIYVHSKDRELIEAGGKLSELDFTFGFRLQNVRRYKPMIASFRLISQQATTRRNLDFANHLLFMFELTDAVEIIGKGKTALQCVTNILNMPEHKMLLTGAKLRVKNGFNYEVG